MEYRPDQKRCLLQRINGDDSKYSFIKDGDGSIQIGYQKCKELAAHLFNVDIQEVGSITDIDRQFSELEVSQNTADESTNERNGCFLSSEV